MNNTMASAQQIWVTPRAIASLIWHIAQDATGIVGLAAPDHAGLALSKANATQAVHIHDGDNGLSFEVFVIMQRGVALEQAARDFSDLLQSALAKALERPVKEVILRIQSVQ